MFSILEAKICIFFSHEPLNSSQNGSVITFYGPGVQSIEHFTRITCFLTKVDADQDTYYIYIFFFAVSYFTETRVCTCIDCEGSVPLEIFILVIGRQGRSGH